MEYSIKQLASLAEVSVRTLHHYDQIGILKPARKKNKYRSYGESELLRLQQILFFRELEFPLKDIKKIIDSPAFDMSKALRDHRKMIEIKKKRLSGLIRTIDKTLNKLDNKKLMTDEELYSNFSKEEAKQYAEEARQRWGNTDAYKQSMERARKLSKEDFERIGKEAEELLKEIVANMPEGAKSDKVQSLISKHYEALRTFYDPNPHVYRGLAEMYVADKRFAAYYEKFHQDLPQFMRDAMIAFCDKLEKKN